MTSAARHIGIWLVSAALVGCSPVVRTVLPVVAPESVYPAALLAPAGGVWQNQHITGVALQRARRKESTRQLAAYPSATAGGWGSAGLTLSGAITNGPAAVFNVPEAPSALWNKVFFLTKTGNLYKLDRASTVVPAPLALGGTFSSTVVTLNSSGTRLYLIDDAGRFIVVNTVTMAWQAVATLGAAVDIAPVFDPFTSATNGSRDDVYLATNGGTIYRYTVTRDASANGFSAINSGTYNVATVNPIFSSDGTNRLRAAPLVLNGVIYCGDTAGFFHQYNTATGTDTSIKLGAPVNATPSIDFGPWTSNTPAYAFVNAGCSCAWINLGTGAVVSSQPLLIDDGDSARKSGSLLSYSRLSTGTWEYMAPRDGLTMNIDPQNLFLPATNPLSVREPDALCPADANLDQLTYNVITVTGGNSGTTDGSASVAKFNTPRALCVAPDGGYYICDSGNNRIRKVAADGSVTTVAGSSQGYVDGTGSAARFYDPSGIVVDSSGNLFVVDRYNHRIRKVTPAGVVTTFAGTTNAAGMGGYVNATGTAAKFDTPTSIAIDAQDNLYVSEIGNHTIRKITPAGVVTTLAGNGSAGSADGTGTAARFNQPYGLSRLPNGDLMLADTFNHRIRRITMAGVVTTVAGSSSGAVDGFRTLARFNWPVDCAADSSGGLYITEAGSHIIRRMSASGWVSTIAGTGALGYVDGPSLSAQFNLPRGISVDNTDSLVICDRDNHRIRKAVLTKTLSNGPATGLLRYQAASTALSTGKVYTRAYLSLLPTATGYGKVPEVRLSSPYYGGTTTLWTSTAVANSGAGITRPSVATYSAGQLENAPLSGNNNVSLLDTQYLVYDVTQLFSAVPPGVQRDFGLALVTNSGGKSYYPFGNLELPGNNDTDTTSAIPFFHDRNNTANPNLANFNRDAQGLPTTSSISGERRPLLQLLTSPYLMGSTGIRTSPVINPDTQTAYIFHSNCLFTLRYTSEVAWGDSALNNTTKYTKMNVTQGGDVGTGGGGTYVVGSQRYFADNTCHPLVNFNGSAAFLLDRYPSGANTVCRLNKITLGYDDTDRLVGRGSGTLPTFTVSTDLPSRYLMIDPNDSAATGGSVYFGAGTQAYRFDQ